jgi:hypothetical protein
MKLHITLMVDTAAPPEVLVQDLVRSLAAAGDQVAWANARVETKPVARYEREPRAPRTEK